MSFLSSLWRKRGKDVEGSALQNQSTIHSTADSQVSAAYTGESTSTNEVRKDIIRVILKQTLTHNGIPTAWLAAQPLVTKSRERSTGLHIRFSILHWDVRLMQHAFDFQENFNDRLLALDPEAENWLLGYSWQFKVPGMSPGAMPHPGSWTTNPKAGQPRATAQITTLPGGSADVISGPVVISRPPAQHANGADGGVKADLEALMALRAFDSEKTQTFAATEPSTLRRE